MYSKIMVPVDLRHLDALQKALTTAADLSKHYRIPLCYVGVTTATPSELSHTPEEFAAKLEAFAKAQAEAHGVAASAKTMVSHDPAVDLNETLTKAVAETGADLVVMATHAPNVTDHLWSGHGAGVAAHAAVSVFLVR